MSFKFEDFCQNIKPRNVHRDKLSLEKLTGKTKIKYKLAANPLMNLGQFLFFVLTSNSGAYHKSLLVEVKENEWEERNIKYNNFLRETSYIDVTRYEILTQDELTSKILDTNNGFKYIARLPVSRFIELDNKRYKIKSVKKRLSFEIEKLLKEALHVDDILRNLGI